jgi:hypothetical protein
MNTNKFLKWVIYIALAIVPFLAFYVSGFGIGASWNAMLFPYITGKNFAFRILIEIAAAAWLLLMIINKDYRPKKSAILYAYSAFVFILFLSNIFSVNPVRSFFSNFERMEGFISHIHIFLYFILLISFFKTEKAWGKYKAIFFISNIPVLFLAFLQLLGLQSFWPMKFLPALRDTIHKYFYPTQGGNQLDSSLGNSTYLAIYAVFFIFLFFISFIESKERKEKNSWCYLLMVILNLIVLFYTQTRGAQIGFMAGIFVAAIILYFGGKKFQDLKMIRNTSLGLVVGISVIFIGLISLKNTNFIKSSPTLNRLAQVSNFANPLYFFSRTGELKKELYNPTSTYTSLLSISGDGTFTSRLLNIKMSLSGFKERPLLGWGQDNYFYVFAKHNDARMYSQEPWFDRTHNVFMDWLIAGGILGLLTYLSLYFSAIWTMWFSKFARHNKNTKQQFIEKALLTGLLIAYFIHNIFVFDNLISYILFIFVLAYIHLNFMGSKENLVEKDSLSKDTKSKMIIFAPFIIVALCASLYYLNFIYIKANKYIIMGMSPQRQNNEAPLLPLSRSLNSFKEAAKIGGIAKMESREQFAQFGLSLIDQLRSANIPQTSEYLPIYDMVSDYLDSVGEVYKHLVDIKNPDPRSLSIYSTFLRNVNKNEEALKYGSMAYALAPNKQTISQEYIQQLLIAGKFTEANAVARKTYLADTSFNLSKTFLALTEVYIRNFSEAENLLKNGEKYEINQTVEKAYLSTNSLDKLIPLLESNLKLDKTDIQSTILLAEAYVDNGQKYMAIQVLNNLAKQKPDLKPQIDAYIKGLEK